MSLLVDTSVWSLAMRRDVPSDVAEVAGLFRAVDGGEAIYSTGIILQELLQGFADPRARELILDRFAALPFLVPDRVDHVQAAELRNGCRRRGIQIGTVDALIAQLCLHHELRLMTTDRDFEHVAEHVPLELWAS